VFDQKLNFKIMGGGIKAGNLVSNHELVLLLKTKKGEFTTLSWEPPYRGYRNKAVKPCFIFILSTCPDLAIMAGLLIILTRAASN